MEDRDLFQEFTELPCEDIKLEHIQNLQEWSKNLSGQLAVTHIQKLLKVAEHLINDKEIKY